MTDKVVPMSTFAQNAETYFAERPELDPDRTSLTFNNDGTVKDHFPLAGHPGYPARPPLGGEVDRFDDHWCHRHDHLALERGCEYTPGGNSGDDARLAIPVTVVIYRKPQTDG